MDRRLEELRAQARYWRDKHALYKAKVHGPRPTSPGRLMELERAADGAHQRLLRAEREADAANGRD